jgi:hypothetical protein
MHKNDESEHHLSDLVLRSILRSRFCLLDYFRSFCKEKSKILVFRQLSFSTTHFIRSEHALTGVQLSDRAIIVFLLDLLIFIYKMCYELVILHFMFQCDSPKIQ